MRVFSVFGKGVFNTTPTDQITLGEAYNYIISDEPKKATNELRSETKQEKKSQIKKNRFKLVTFSGIFEERRANELIKFSHLICLDIDDVKSASELKSQIMNLPEFQPVLVFVSPSGNGLKVVYRVENIIAEDVPAAYSYLADKIEDQLQVNVDRTPKSVASACFLPWDPDAYINKDAKSIKIPQNVLNLSTTSTSYTSDSPEIDQKKARACAEYIEENQIDMTNAYNDWVKIGFALAELGEEGRDIFHTVSKTSPKYDHTECDEKFTYFIQNTREQVHIGTFFEYCKEFSIPLSKLWKEFTPKLNLVKSTSPFWDAEVHQKHNERVENLLKNRDHSLIQKVEEMYGVPHEVLCENRVGLGSLEITDQMIEEVIFVPYQYGCRGYYFDGDTLRSKDLSSSNPFDSFFGMDSILDRDEVVITEHPFDAMFLSRFRPDMDIISMINPEQTRLTEKQIEQLKYKSEFWSTFYVFKNAMKGGEKKKARSFCRQFADCLSKDSGVYWVNVESQHNAFFQIKEGENEGTADVFESATYIWNTFTETNCFWYTTDQRTPKLTIDELRLSEVLDENGFKKIYLGDSATPSVLNVTDNVVKEVSNHMIMDFIRDHILPKLSKYVAECKTKTGLKLKSKRDLSKVFLKYRRQLLNDNVKAIFETSSLNFLRDDIDTVFLYYQNGAIKVQKDSCEHIDYSQLPGEIWYDQILDRTFHIDSVDNQKSQFEQFIKNVTNAAPERMKAFRTTLGYLLSTYKNVADTRAVILTDEKISPLGHANGGTGKSLFGAALKYIRKQRYIAGRNVDLNSRFAFMDTKNGDQNIFFDDVKKEFNFGALFNVITNDMQVEPKYENRFTIPFAESPKIMIATNAVIKGAGTSFRRRQAILEFSDYFNYNHKPEHEFGGRFFVDWDPEEWIRFDRFMIQCIQEYLAGGMSSYTTNSYNTRKIRYQTSTDFFQWAEENLETDVEYSANILFSGKDRETNPHMPKIVKPKNSNGESFGFYLNCAQDLDERQMKTFKKWLRYYAGHREWEIQERPSNGYSRITFTEK